MFLPRRLLASRAAVSNHLTSPTCHQLSLGPALVTHLEPLEFASFENAIHGACVPARKHEAAQLSKRARDQASERSRTSWSGYDRSEQADSCSEQAGVIEVN